MWYDILGQVLTEGPPQNPKNTYILSGSTKPHICTTMGGSSVVVAFAILLSYHIQFKDGSHWVSAQGKAWLNQGYNASSLGNLCDPFRPCNMNFTASIESEGFDSNLTSFTSTGLLPSFGLGAVAPQAAPYRYSSITPPLGIDWRFILGPVKNQGQCGKMTCIYRCTV